MADGSPQCENGYTRIANELLEALAKIRIPGEANQILMAVMRQTYGFCKKTDRISISKFIEITGLSRQSVQRGTSKLIEMNILRKNADGFIASYEINKHFNTWKPSAKKRTVRNNADPHPQKSGRNHPQKSGPQKKERKYTKEKEEALDVYCQCFRNLAPPGPVVVEVHSLVDDYGIDAVKEAFIAAGSGRKPYPWAKARIKNKEAEDEHFIPNERLAMPDGRRPR